MRKAAREECGDLDLVGHFSLLGREVRHEGARVPTFRAPLLAPPQKKIQNGDAVSPGVMVSCAARGVVDGASTLIGLASSRNMPCWGPKGRLGCLNRRLNSLPARWRISGILAGFKFNKNSPFKGGNVESSLKFPASQGK